MYQRSRRVRKRGKKKPLGWLITVPLALLSVLSFTAFYSPPGAQGRGPSVSHSRQDRLDQEWLKFIRGSEEYDWQENGPELALPDLSGAKQFFLTYGDDGRPEVEDFFEENFAESVADGPLGVLGTDQDGNVLQFTLDVGMQQKAEQLLQEYKIERGVILAMDANSGQILAAASSAPDGERELITRASFPAASLFKIITAAAAVEKAGMHANSTIKYRGGDYSLSRHNFKPDPRRDTRKITLGRALGNSCNPAFARVALKELSRPVLAQYAARFGFNSEVFSDTAVETSLYQEPESDFQTARTAAGFGDVTISPVHAASLFAALANEGKMMRPHFLRSHFDFGGRLKYRVRPQVVEQVVLASTAKQLLEMMESTVSKGTAKKPFRRLMRRLPAGASLSAKTGTLSGEDPKGIYRWFVGVLSNDKITGQERPTSLRVASLSVVSLVIDPGGASISGTGLASLFLDHYVKHRLL